MTVINPRFITNKQEFNDRVNTYREEYHEGARLRVESIQLEAQNIAETDELEKQIFDLTFLQKMREIKRIKEQTKEIEDSLENALAGTTSQ